MFYPTYIYFPPIEAEEAYAKVFWDADYNYENPSDPATKLAALKDAEDAFNFIASGLYFAPKRLNAAMEKISAVVGTKVDCSNVRALRKAAEREVSPSAPAPSNALSRIKRCLNRLSL